MKIEFIVMLIFSPSIISLSQLVSVCKAYRENTFAHLFSEGFVPAGNLHILAQMFIIQVCFKKNSG